MDPGSAARLARHLMDEHGLRGWTFGFNRRKRGLGLCRYDPRRIELSLYFIAANGEAAIRDTLLHEIAHALAGSRAGHGPRWKAVCVRIGARPERCDTTARMPRGAWRGDCPGCGHTYSRHRRPLAKRHYACRRCGPERGRIVFRRAIAVPM